MSHDPSTLLTSHPGIPDSGYGEESLTTPAKPDRKPVPARGRPRNALADRLILEAAVALLAEGQTLDALTFGAVARRARVGKATIYRRWRDKRCLLRAAVEELERHPQRPLPRGGSAYDDLVLTMRQTRQWLRESPAAGILPQMWTELRRDPQLADDYFARVLQTERSRLQQVLNHGVATGDFRADLDTEMVSRMLYGLLVEELWHAPRQGDTRPAAGAGEMERAVRELIRGLLAPAPAAVARI